MSGIGVDICSGGLSTGVCSGWLAGVLRMDFGLWVVVVGRMVPGGLRGASVRGV